MALAAQEAIEEKQGHDPVVLDVRRLSSVTDFFLIAGAGSPPHLKALRDEIEKALKANNLSAYRKAGSAESGWMVLDYLDVVVHLFLPEQRAYYGLEELWNDAERVAG